MIVTLREVIASDLAVFYEHQQDAQACRLVACAPRDREAFLAHWAKTAADPAVRRDAVLVDRAVAGYVASFERLGRREVAYWLGREHWGKGVATIALGLFLPGETTRPLWARVAKHHAASRRVLEKCGFKVVGEGVDEGAPGGPVEEFLLELAA